MMIIFDKDGACPGRITEISSGPDPVTHGKVLDRLRRAWIHEPAATASMILTHYVDPAARRIVERPRFALFEDGDTIRGVPAGTRVTVSYKGLCVESAIVDDGEIEFAPEYRGAYRLTFDRWPFLPLQLDLER